jgi:hypothetical protein
MRAITRVLFTLAVLLGPAIGVAHAITVKEIVQYKSLGPKILISLIEADRSVFHLTAEEVSKLKEQGVDESVILAMIETGKPKSQRKTAEPSDLAQPDETVPPLEPPDSSLSSVDAPTAPVIVNVDQQVSQQVDSTPATVVVPVPIAVPVIEHGRRPLPEPRHETQPAAPQYWGYGGQKRPDSWGPTPAPPPQHSDAKSGSDKADKTDKTDPGKKGGGS